jgi:hypothetical protein
VNTFHFRKGVRMAGGMVLVKTKAEEQLLITLLQEFGPKVILSRRFEPTETFKHYTKLGIHGVLNVEHDGDTGETIFEIALPPTFVGYIEYEIGKLRNFVSAAKEKDSNTQK